MAQDEIGNLLALLKYAEEDPRIQALKRMHETDYGPLLESINGPQGYPRDVFNRVNPAGWDAFMASGPYSENIEDRRLEDDPDPIRTHNLQMLRAGGIK